MSEKEGLKIGRGEFVQLMACLVAGGVVGNAVYELTGLGPKSVEEIGDVHVTLKNDILTFGNSFPQDDDRINGSLEAGIDLSHPLLRENSSIRDQLRALLMAQLLILKPILDMGLDNPGFATASLNLFADKLTELHEEMVE